MEQPTRKPRPLAGRCPGPAKISYRESLSVEHPGNRVALPCGEPTGLLPQFPQGRPESIGEYDRPGLPILGNVSFDPNRSRLEIDLGPLPVIRKNSIRCAFRPDKLPSLL